MWGYEQSTNVPILQTGHRTLKKRIDNEESHLFPQSTALITWHSDPQVNILY